MTFFHPEIDVLVDCDNGMYNTVVIENQSLLFRLCMDIRNMIEGREGEGVLAVDHVPQAMSKRAELVDSMLFIDPNSRTLLTRIAQALEKRALDAEFYERTLDLTGKLEILLDDLAMDLECPLIFENISIGSMIKAAGLKVDCVSDKITDRLLTYMELLTRFTGEHMFFLVNMRSFVGDADMQRFADTVRLKNYQVIGLESHVYPRLEKENRVVIDSDLCLVESGNAESAYSEDDFYDIF